jgi:hypothetical protein
MRFAPNSRQRRSYLVEFQTIGNSVKVSAIDPETLVEVSIVGPISATESDLSRLAARKLEYVLKKRAQRPDTRPGVKI